MSVSAATDAAGDALDKSASQITIPIKFSWGIGALGVAVLMNAISFLALFYMVSVLHIDPWLAGTVIFATKLVDVVSDPIVGGWTDKYKSKGSRRRPFMFAGSFVSAASLALVFTTPVFDNQYLSAAYISMALIIYTIGYTLYNIPYMSMPAEMTTNYHERSAIHAYRMVFVAIGSMLVGVLAPVVTEALGRTEWRSYAIVGSVGAVVVLVAMLTAWKGTEKAKFTRAVEKPPALWSEVKHVFRDRIFLRLLAAKSCQLFAGASINAAMLFFIINILAKDMNSFAVYAAATVSASIIFSPILVMISKKIGKSQTYIFGNLLLLGTVVSWVFAGPDDPVWTLPLRGFFLGIGGSAGVIMAMSMLTDIVSYDSKLHDVKREGIFTALYSFAEKACYALGPLVVGIAMSVAGFDEKLSAEQLQTPAIRQALLLGMAYIPAVMAALSILLLWGYKLREDDL